MPREKAGGNVSLNRFVSMWERIIVLPPVYQARFKGSP